MPSLVPFHSYHAKAPTNGSETNIGLSTWALFQGSDHGTNAVCQLPILSFRGGDIGLTRILCLGYTKAEKNQANSQKKSSDPIQLSITHIALVF